MKIVKAADGKKTVKISKEEWQSIGKQAGWRDMFQAPAIDPAAEDVPSMGMGGGDAMAAGMMQENKMIMDFAKKLQANPPQITKEQILGELSHLDQNTIDGIIKKLEKYMAV